jgi:prepilin-type N-terminal cleavage/methylation domain-containing protein
MEQLRKRLRRNNQKGFTLIELLVVVSILGILAAVVTLSLVGIESNAKKQAQAAELSTVQAAFDTDTQVHSLDAHAACTALTGSATSGGLQVSGMTAWPGTGTGEPLYPNFVHTSNSTYFYYCADSNSATLGSR